MTAIKPNYRRARKLALEIEATRNTLDELRNDPDMCDADLDDLRAELQHLEREFFLTGVSSEYDL